MQPGNTEEFSRTASHLLPGHSLFSSSLDPFYFSPNAVHFAALDTLIDFTSKVSVHGTVLQWNLSNLDTSGSEYSC